MELCLDPRARGVLTLAAEDHARLHFSQFGEDCFLWHLFGNRANGFYVDVGCHDPLRYSNTHLLHRALGWRGINLDADPRAVAKFRAARPGDVNIHIGVAMERGSREFHLFQDGAVNTFDQALAGERSGQFRRGATVTVPTCPLSEILDRAMPANTAIDYLNVDCEGWDREVLLSNDWTKYRPEVISVEIHDLDLENAGANPTAAFLKQQGYRLRSHYYVTTFFVLAGH